MNLLKITGAMALASALSLSSVAFAASGVAELVNVSGKVLVQQGEGFVPVSGAVLLQPGDQIMVGEEASATINYLGGGCAVSVNDQTVVSVSKKAPCAKGDKVALVGENLIAPTEGGSSSAAVGVVAAFMAAGVLLVVVAESDGSSGN